MPSSPAAARPSCAALRGGAGPRCATPWPGPAAASSSRCCCSTGVTIWSWPGRCWIAPAAVWARRSPRWRPPLRSARLVAPASVLGQAKRRPDTVEPPTLRLLIRLDPVALRRPGVLLAFGRLVVAPGRLGVLGFGRLGVLASGRLAVVLAFVVGLIRLAGGPHAGLREDGAEVDVGLRSEARHGLRGRQQGAGLLQ